MNRSRFQTAKWGMAAVLFAGLLVVFGSLTGGETAAEDTAKAYTEHDKEKVDPVEFAVDNFRDESVGESIAKEIEKARRK